MDPVHRFVYSFAMSVDRDVAVWIAFLAGVAVSLITVGIIEAVIHCARKVTYVGEGPEGE